jgi:pimeloyl-ACP methyl ester carboxylesterase
MDGTLSNAGLLLNYAVSGPTSAPPVVFLHGLSQTHHTWSEVVAEIGDTHRCWRLDFRGHGASGRAPGRYTFNGYADDAVAMVERAVHESGGTPAVVVGHSLGGVSAYLVAHRRPELVRSLLLEDPPLYVTRRGVFETTFAGTMFPMLRDAAAGLQASGMDADAVRAIVASQPAGFTAGTNDEVLTDSDLTSRAIGMLALDLGVLDSAVDCSMSDQNEDAPVTVSGRLLHGERELGGVFWPEHADRFATAAPRVSMHHVEGAGHFVHNTRRDVATFVAHLQAVLAAD